jgi:hypothetical protein
MKFLHVLFRILLGVSLIAVALDNYKNIPATETKIVKNIENWKNTIKGQDKIFETISNYTSFIAKAYTYCFALTGLFIILGLKKSSFYIYVSLVLEVVLVNSPIFVMNEETLTHAFKMLAVFGGVLNS